MKTNTPSRKDGSFDELIGHKERRKIRSRKNPGNALTGFRFFGVVGWTVAIMTLIGTGLGVWLDRNYPQSFSWTLSGLLSGLVIGSIVAWNFLDKENKDMNKKDTDHE